MRTKTCLVVSICLLTLVAGCVATSALYIGKPVKAQQVVRLPAGVPQSGTWETFDMSINYQALVDGDVLELFIQGSLTQHYQILYNGVRGLRVYLFLLDADNRILETLLLPVSLTHAEDRFQRRQYVKVSSAVKGFSFGYSGFAYEWDGSTHFDNLP